MVSVVDRQRDILLSPTGTNVWSGQLSQSLNSEAVTWSLAKQLYGPHGPYLIIPLSLFIGMVPTTIQWLVWKVSCISLSLSDSFIDYFSDGHELVLSELIQFCFPSSTWSIIRLNLVFYLLITQVQYSSNLSAGVNSATTSGIIVGIVSQLWLRRYHPGWYKKYNYVMGGALDGGAQVMIFILSFAVFGASGVQMPFPYVRLSSSLFKRQLMLVSQFHSGQEIRLSEM